MNSEWQDPPLPECIEPAEPLSPAVYALELKQPVLEPMAIERYHDNFDAPQPDWVLEAFWSDAVYYVGAANEVGERIREHIEGHNRSAAIMAVYPPRRVEAIWEMPSADAAFQAERSKADDLQREYPDAYIHVR